MKDYPRFQFTISFTVDNKMSESLYDCFLEELIFNEANDCIITSLADQHFQLDFDRDAAGERAAWTTAIAGVIESAQACQLKLTGFCLSRLNPDPDPIE